MIGKESMKTREESEEGLSFAELSYQTFQAYDFLHLYRNNQCTVQIGGSDQYGNITAGTELIRRVEAIENDGDNSHRLGVRLYIYIYIFMYKY